MSAKFPLITRKLNGGLRLLLLPRQDVASVTALVLIGVGSRFETPKQWGLSHFLEHMFFKGTERRPTTKEIAEAIDGLGGEFNAFTGEEYTGYYVKVAAEHLDTGADVVADILLQPLFPPEEIERERGVIQEEIKMYTDMPMRHVQHLWQRALYANHPLGRRIDGTHESVSAFKRRDFLSYVKKHYHTANTVVAVAGQFDPKRVEKLMTGLFADLPPGKRTFAKKAPGAVPAKRFVSEHRAHMDQTQLMVGVPGVAWHDKRRVAADMMSIILGGGMSSRLFLSVRERHGLAYSVRTSSDNYVDSGGFVTQAGVRSDRADFALELILNEYNRIMQEPVSKEELQKAREMVRGRLVLDLEETNALALFAGGQELLTAEIETPEEIWRKVSAVSAQDIQRLAQELLVPEKRAMALLSPRTDIDIFEKVLVKS